MTSTATPLTALRALVDAINYCYVIGDEPDEDAIYQAFQSGRDTLRSYELGDWTPDMVRALRADLNLTQTQLAHALGYSDSTIHNWERGTHKPNSPALSALAQKGVSR